MQQFTQKDLDDLLSYIKHLEGQVEDLKATAITVVQQRNAAMSKLKEITSRLHKPLIESATLDVDYDTINPEQYKQINQF
jgi:sugar-specific transcriptional regulator TrmB